MTSGRTERKHADMTTKILEISLYLENATESPKAKAIKVSVPAIIKELFLGLPYFLFSV